MSIKIKLALMILILGLFTLLGTSLYLSTHLMASHFQTIESSLQSQLITMDKLITDSIGNIEFDLATMAMNPDVLYPDHEEFTSFLNADEKSFKYQYTEPEKRIIELMSHYRQTHPGINSVYMGRENGSFVRSHKRARPTRYDPRERPWYKLAKKRPHAISRTDPYHSLTAEHINIATVKALLGPDGRFLGVLGMDLTLKTISNFIKEVWVPHNGLIMLLDGQGRVIAHKDRNFLLRDIRSLVPDKFRQILYNSSGYVRCEVGATDYYAFFHTCHELGWKLIALTPAKAIMREGRHYSWTIILTLGISLLILMGLVMAGLQWFVARPLSKLSGGARHITKTGDLTWKFEINTEDEMGVLASSFNEMTLSLNQAYQKLDAYSAGLEKKVTERTLELEQSNQDLKHEITERKQAQQALREKEAHLRGLVHSSADCIIVLDPDRMIIEVNPAFSDVFGFTAAEVLGQSVEILHIDRETFEKCGQLIYPEVKEKGFWRGEWNYRKKNGSVFPVETVLSEIITDKKELSGYVAFMRDMTERKQMEKAIIEARIAADEANRAKSDFLANMSHEIRTPMNAIIGMSHLALKTELSPKQSDYLNKIQAASHSLLGIINDILDFSKIEAGKLEMEEVDFSLEEVLNNVSSLIGIKAQEKGLEFLVHLNPQTPQSLKGDPLRLGQVLINLANNAVKFTEQGEIVISTGLKEKNDSGLLLEFSVKDTGIGLNEKQKSRLFKAFSQADSSTTRKYGGTGLGLTICKRLVELMGGEIRVDSDPGKGSDFRFTARFSKSEATKPRILLPAPDLRGMKVLAVDDNASSRAIFQDMLSSMSFEVALSPSGHEAIEEIKTADKERPFDLVLLDWKMPGLDGIKTAELIKSDDSLTHQPKVIMITAYGREEIMRQATDLKLDGFLIKPVSQSVLFDTIMHAFGSETTSAKDLSANGGMNHGLEALGGARLLLVEDNEINQQVAREILENAGFSVALADNGAQAVEMAASKSFQAVLMDIQMPVMDGYRATAAIRNTPGLESLPIIAMTAHAMSGDREKVLAAGMNDHVTKPIDPEKLFSTLAHWIDASQIPSPSAGPFAQGSQKDSHKPENHIPPLKGFAVEDGLAKVGGNRALFRKLLTKFYEDNRDAWDRLNNLLADDRREEALRFLHTIKGVAGNLAAGMLYKSAEKLEPALRGKKGDPEKLMLDFKHNLEVVLDSLNGQFMQSKVQPANSGKPQARIDPEAVAPVLKKLADQMESDIGSALETLEELRPQLSGSAFGDAFAHLDKCLQGFDTDGARKHLAGITAKLKL